MRKAPHVEWVARHPAPIRRREELRTMFKKLILSAAVAGTALTALPAAAQAQGRGYYDGYGYQQTYRGDRYDRYDRRYDRSGRYDRRYYDRRDYDRRYRNHYGRRCSGTTGTIIGAIAGGLLGRAIDGGRDRTTGLIIGGAAGALAGRAIDRDNCRR